jgi:hypothetical protein
VLVDVTLLDPINTEHSDQHVENHVRKVEGVKQGKRPNPEHSL